MPADMTRMCEATATIENLQGLHMRPAGKLTQLAQSFTADITVSWDGQTINAKSAIEVTMLGAPQGAELVFRAEGDDAEDAVRALTELVADRFGLGDHD